MIFGDNESYQNKFMTCARARPLGSQCLGADFYRKESTKPLFAKHELLTIENLYRYRIIMELFKIVKFRAPMSLYSLLNISDRKDTLMITPSPTKNFIYKSAFHWNTFRKVLGNLDFYSSCSSVKNLLIQSLLGSQGRYGADWCDKNFCEF